MAQITKILGLIWAFIIANWKYLIVIPIGWLMYLGLKVVFGSEKTDWGATIPKDEEFVRKKVLELKEAFGVSAWYEKLWNPTTWTENDKEAYLIIDSVPSRLYGYFAAFYKEKTGNVLRDDIDRLLDDDYKFQLEVNWRSFG